MKTQLEIIHEAEEKAYTEELAAYEDALKRGVPAWLLAKPEPPQSLAVKAARISQQNNFRIGYVKYQYGRRRR